MLKRILVFVLFSLIILLASSIKLKQNYTIKAQTLQDLSEHLQIPQPIKTTSEFEDKLETTDLTIEKPIKYIDDPQKELGEETTLEEGVDGKITKVIKITLHKGREYSRELISQEKILAKEKIISKGSKIIWRSLQTPDGEIKYWRKLRVWATHYDKTCLGCDEWTAIGMKQGRGVIAVDPKVIKLRSKVYIPGYGEAVAGDTGGAIKGNIIDLGFDDAKTSGWSARFVDIYLL